MSVVIRNPPLVATFELPEQDMINSVKVGDYVKLIFGCDEPRATERMWVQVVQIGDYWHGTLANRPVSLDMRLGDSVIFKADQIIDVDLETR